MFVCDEGADQRVGITAGVGEDSFSLVVRTKREPSCYSVCSEVLLKMVPGTCPIQVLPVTSNHGISVTRLAFHIGPEGIWQNKSIIPKRKCGIVVQTSGEFIIINIKEDGIPQFNRMIGESILVI